MNEPSEVDLILNWMRQSSLADVRKHLEDLDKETRNPNKTLALLARTEFRGIMLLFKNASNNAPIP